MQPSQDNIHEGGGKKKKDKEKDKGKRSFESPARSTLITKEGKKVLRRRTANDILCGRGVPILNYHGNIRLHRIIDCYRSVYLGASRKMKPNIVKEILKEINEGGALFLKRSEDDESSWIEVSDAYAREKVSHALRCKDAARKIGETESQAQTKFEAANHQPGPNTATAGPRLPSYLYNTSGVLHPQHRLHLNALRGSNSRNVVPIMRPPLPAAFATSLTSPFNGQLLADQFTLASAYDTNDLYSQVSLPPYRINPFATSSSSFPSTNATDLEQIQSFAGVQSDPHTSTVEQIQSFAGVQSDPHTRTVEQIQSFAGVQSDPHTRTVERASDCANDSRLLALQLILNCSSRAEPSQNNETGW